MGQLLPDAFLGTRGRRQEVKLRGLYAITPKRGQRRAVRDVARRARGRRRAGAIPQEQARRSGGKGGRAPCQTPRRADHRERRYRARAGGECRRGPSGARRRRLRAARAKLAGRILGRRATTAWSLPKPPSRRAQITWPLAACSRRLPSLERCAHRIAFSLGRGTSACRWLRSAELRSRTRRSSSAPAQTCWRSFPISSRRPISVCAPANTGSCSHEKRIAVRACAARHPGRRQLSGTRLSCGRRRAAVLRARLGCLPVGRGSPPLHRLCRVLGPMVAGHSHPAVVEAVQEAASRALSFGAPTEAEVELAEMLCRLVPSLDQVRLVSSGTEATMTAIRLARAFTAAQPDRQVRGLLSRPCRRAAGQGRSGALAYAIQARPACQPKPPLIRCDGLQRQLRPASSVSRES